VVVMLRTEEEEIAVRLAKQCRGTLVDISGSSEEKVDADAPFPAILSIVA